MEESGDLVILVVFVALKMPFDKGIEDIGIGSIVKDVVSKPKNSLKNNKQVRPQKCSIHELVQRSLETN